MELTIERLEELETLACLEVEEGERRGLLLMLNERLHEMSPPEATILLEEETAVLKQGLREDSVRSSTARALLLDQAPETDGEAILVPRTVQ